jgi:hypothetical protein
VTDIKLCKDCRWCALASVIERYYCVSPQQTFSLVTGETITGPCEDRRRGPDECGPEGKWWEARDE